MDIFARLYNFTKESSYKVFGLPKCHLNIKINDFYNRLGKIAHTYWDVNVNVQTKKHKRFSDGLFCWIYKYV